MCGCGCYYHLRVRWKGPFCAVCVSKVMAGVPDGRRSWSWAFAIQQLMTPSVMVDAQQAALFALPPAAKRFLVQELCHASLCSNACVDLACSYVVRQPGAQCMFGVIVGAAATSLFSTTTTITSLSAL